MRMLIAIFLPPLYFFVVGRPISGVIHLVIWVISIPLIFAFGMGVFIWFIQAFLAVWDLRKRLVTEQATILATKMAEAFQKPGADQAG